MKIGTEAGGLGPALLGLLQRDAAPNVAAATRGNVASKTPRVEIQAANEAMQSGKAIPRGSFVDIFA